MCLDVSTNANQTRRFAWLQVQQGDLDMNFVVLLFKRMGIVYFRSRHSLIVLKRLYFHCHHRSQVFKNQ